MVTHDISFSFVGGLKCAILRHAYIFKGEMNLNKLNSLILLAN